MSSDSMPSLFCRLLDQEHFSYDELLRLSRHEHFHIKWTVAKHKNADEFIKRIIYMQLESPQMNNQNILLYKPSIKKHYQLKEEDTTYPDDLIEFEKSILVNNIDVLHTIWPDIPFDLIRNNIDCLEIVIMESITSKTIDWLRENIKPRSFLHMINKHYQKVGCINMNILFKDTFDQLLVLLEKNIEVPPPKRWRFMEFHDHVSFLFIEKTTENNPIKTIIESYMDGDYILSQPKDTVSLKMWAKKVKNCVSSRETGIGEKHWIFFLEKAGAPLYTIETTMDYAITEIKGNRNSPVDVEGQVLAMEMIHSAVDGVS